MTDIPKQASIAGVVTFTIALYLSKCAMVAFLGRITKTHSRILFYQGVNGALAAIGFISILVVTVDCTPGSGYYWAIYDNRFAGCPTQVGRDLQRLFSLNTSWAY